MITAGQKAMLLAVIDQAYGEDPCPSDAIKDDGSIDYDIGDTLCAFIAAECHDGMTCETLEESRDECARMMRTAADQLDRVAHALENVEVP